MIKIELEFPVKSSIRVLYNAISTVSGLTSWFCDDIRLENNKKHWVFCWKDSEQVAKVLEMEEDYYVRFKWLEEDEETFFEFRIDIDEITGDISLVVIDFVDEDDVDTSTALWENQIKDLFKSLGA
ncbi:MAG: hypothetical protein RLZZ414_218 [Bacteroidota bacterium]|jgi:uncharacterized protein YndB with AHSA1/START domain